MTKAIPTPLDGAATGAPALDRLARGPLLIGLDFDGTLAPIVDRPDDARLDATMRERLKRLVSLVPTAVVSGRDLDDLGARVAVPGVILVGSHGLEIARPDGSVDRAEGLEQSDAELERLVDRLRDATRGLAGVLVEPKRHSVAIHWRLAAPDDELAAGRIVAQAAFAFPEFMVGRGKMVAEFRPAIDRHKGGAINLLRTAAASGGSSPTVLYIGDDVTDEDAFGILDRTRDVGVLVATPPRATAAGWWLPDPDAVGGFLDRLIEARAVATP